MKCVLKSLAKSNALKSRSVCLEIRAFLTHLFGGNCTPVPAPFAPDKDIYATPVKSPLNKGKRWHSTAD